MAVQKAETNGKSKTQEDVAAPKATADPAVSKALILVTMLAVIDIRPSGVNPNVMSEEQFAAFVKEVKATGRIPKPIVVVKTKTGYKIVDGEHACRAAKEAGLTHVSCEIIEADAFEIMRQTVTRNRHGDNNAVLLGQLYSKMLKVGKLSNRELAKKLDLTEGSVRNYLAYGEAFQLRNGYASSGALELISGKTIKQVETYLKLPAAKRDDWLDSGGRLEEAAKLMPAKPSAEKAAAASKAPAAESPESDNEDENNAADAENATPKDKNATPDNDSDAESSPDEGEDSEAGDDDGDADEDADADDDQDSPADATEDVEDGGDTPAESAAPAFDKTVLRELEDAWGRANAATRQKFLAGIMADSGVLSMVRRMIKSGT